MGLFFPTLGPRSSYRTKSDGTYLVYTSYRGEIEADCKQRCVYCDIKNEEHGYEGFVLDHFRPQAHFSSLANDPNNLVLSCPVCNRLKSNHWPLDPTIPDSYQGMVGFLDPFNHDRSQYFNIEPDGRLVPLQPPAQYLEKILKLNRASRLRVRERRILRAELRNLAQIINISALQLLEQRGNGAISEADFNSQSVPLLKALNYLSSAINA